MWDIIVLAVGFTAGLLIGGNSPEMVKRLVETVKGWFK